MKTALGNNWPEEWTDPFARIFQSDLHEKANMANVMVEAGLFESSGKAKAAGWNKPLQGGLHIVGKMRKLVIVYMDKEPGFDITNPFPKI